jgi:hypothetical protein
MLDFVKGDPVKKLRRELDAARARHDKQGARLTAAESHLSDVRGEPVRLARDGAADGALDAAEAKVRAAEERVSTLRTAISNEDDHIAEIERQLAEHADRAQRQETADQLDGWSVEVDEAAKKVDAMISDLAELADRVAHCVPEALGVAIFAGTARSELAVALQQISNELNGRARGVRAGTYAATLPNRPPPPAPPQPAPAVVKIWTIKPVAFKQEGYGQMRVIDLNEQPNVPPALAERAIALGAAVPVGDPRFGKRVSSSRRDQGLGPSLENCVLLDDNLEAEAREQPEPEQLRVLHSRVDPNFEVVDRGPGYTGIKTHGPDVAA